MAFLTSIMRAATPDNPRFSLNDPQAWDAFVGGNESAAGIPINREAALAYSPWWRGITLISRDVGKVPMHVYRRDGEGKERATDHPAYYLLRRKANDFQTAQQFRQQLTGHAISGGNGYAYISRSGDGTPLELLPLDPEVTWPVRVDGEVGYVTQVSGENRKIPAVDMLHVKGYSFDGLMGYSVVQKAKDDLGLGIGTRRYQTIFFKNGARPPVVIEAPGPVPEPTIVAFREQWNKLHTGLDNAHKTAILTHGMKAHSLSFSSEDSQLIEAQNLTIRMVANYIGVPPHKIGDTTRTSFASLEQENQDYLDGALDPWLCTWEEECWDKLLTEEEKRSDEYIVEFLRVALVRADLAARSGYYSTATGGRPWMTPDEVRARENMNPLGGEAAELMTPLNMGQGGRQNEPTKPGPQQPPADDSEDAADTESVHRGLIIDAASRAARRVVLHAGRAASKPKEFLAAIDSLAADHAEIVTAILSPAVAVLNAATGHVHTAADCALDLFAMMREDLLRVSDTATARTLPAAVEAWAGQFVAEWPTVLAGWWFPEGMADA